MNQHYKDLIAEEFKNCVNNTISRLAENEETYRPFHSALLSDECIFWSRFERSFSTSFGQRVIEEIAKLVVLSNGAEEAQRQKETFVQIDKNYADAIERHIDSIRSGNRSDGWNNVLSSITRTEESNNLIEKRIISDLWWRKNGIDNYVSLKTVKPNIDQTAVAKQDCLTLKIANANCNAYFGLPYNPYGERKSDYKHNPPMGVFNFHTDSVVLIGKELWDTLGGDGCYEEILSIAEAVGIETRATIRNTYE